jgi:hypothetical protein
MNLSVLASYGRSFLATTLTAIFAIGKLPTEFTAADWGLVCNAIWIAVIPVIIRYLNPNDSAFGIKK